MVASVPKHDKPSSSAPLELVAALKLAVDDRRRVDELVTCFDYSGSVEVDGRQYVGQGAVKRFFHALFLDANVHDLTLLGGDEASMAKGDLYLLLETGAGEKPYPTRAHRWGQTRTSKGHVEMPGCRLAGNRVSRPAERRLHPAAVAPPYPVRAHTRRLELGGCRGEGDEGGVAGPSSAQAVARPQSTAICAAASSCRQVVLAPLLEYCPGGHPRDPAADLLPARGSPPELSR
eukprot:scaffold22790_cov134-Isochrysis_galbana.AAC.1